MAPLGKAGTGLALLVCASASLVNAQNIAQPSLSPLAFTPPIEAIQLELLRDKPYVLVMVNGRGPYRFLVDTGTGTQH